MNKRALITLAIFGGLAVLYFVSEQTQQGGGSAVPDWEIPAVKTTADKIEIVREGETVVLEKSDDGWKVVGAKSYPASKTSVEGLLDLFESPVGVDLKVPVTEDELARYELSGDKAITVTFSAAGKTLSSFVVGKAVGKRTFIKPLDETVVYRAKVSMRFKIDKKPTDWREKKVFSIKRDDVIGLTLHHPQGSSGSGGPITLTRDSEEKDGKTEYKDTWRISAPVQEAADKSTASSLVGSVINVRVADYADDVAVADAGFGADSFKVTIKMKDDKSKTLIFGGTVGEDLFDGKYKDDLFAMSEGTDTVYVIRKYTRKNAAKTLEELRNKEVFADLKREDIAGLTLEHSGITLSFSKGDDGKWKATAPAELADKLNESPLNSLLSSLANLRAARVLTGIDDATGGFTPGARKARVTVSVKDKEDVILLVGGLADEAKKEWYARLENQPSPVWVLRDYVVRQLTKDAAGFKKKEKA